MHRRLKILLSIYVDDFAMAGPAEALEPMWVKLRETLDLEPAVPMDGNVYVGCEQTSVAVSPEEVATKRAFFQRILETPSISTEDGDNTKLSLIHI